MWRINNKEKQWILISIAFYNILRVLITSIKVPENYSYLLWAIPNFIIFSVFLAIFIFLVYRPLRRAINNYTLFISTQLIVFHLLASVLMSDFQKIAKVGYYQDAIPISEQSIFQRLSDGHFEFYNYISFLLTLIILMIIDYIRHIFPYKGEAKAN